MRNLFLATMILACAASWPAQACKIDPPGTPAEEARRTLEGQTEFMGEATTIFLAEVVDTRPMARDRFPAQGRAVVLRPVRALRGEAPRGSLALQHTRYTTCGLEPWFDALWGEPGQPFVIFATAARPRQDDVIATVRRDRLVQPDLLAALAGRAR